MMSMGFNLVVLLCCVILVQGAPKFQGKPIPNYISTCKRSDPELSKCVLSRAKETIPKILKGDPAYKLQSLSPYHMDKADLSPNKDLSLILTDIDIIGAEYLEILDVDFDLNKKHVAAKFHAKLLTIVGKYDVSGQIMVLPIKGKGPIKLDFEDCAFTYSFDYDVITQDDGNEYIANIKPNLEYTVNNAKYRLDNLFDGNKELGENVNKVLNDNSKEVLAEFGQVVEQMVHLLAFKPLQAYLTKIPYNVLFPQ